MTREEAIRRFKGIINSMSISVAQSKFYPSKAELNELCDMAIEALADRPIGEWTTEQVAEMLANLFRDECACNFNGIDEWLPFACKYAHTQCPDPKEKHGCWMQFLIQGGGTDE